MAFTEVAGRSNKLFSTCAGMVVLGLALKVLVSVVKDFAAMKIEDIGQGLITVALALIAIGNGMQLMPSNMLSSSAGMVVVGIALKILASAMSDFAKLSWGDVAKGLVVIAGSLLLISDAMFVMQGTIGGSAALLIASAALVVLASALKTLADISLGGMIKGLIAIASTFFVLAVSAMVMAPLIPTLLGLAGAFALFGISILAIGGSIEDTADGFPFYLAVCSRNRWRNGYGRRNEYHNYGAAQPHSRDC